MLLSVSFLILGKLKPTMAFMSGKLKIKGNIALAIKLEKLMTHMRLERKNNEDNETEKNQAVPCTQ